MSDTALIVHIVFRLDYGGLENGVANLVNRLKEAPYRHAVIALTEATDFRLRLRPDVAVYSLDKRPGKDPRTYWKLFLLLRKLRPAVVHTRNFGTLDCVLIAFLAGVPTRIHGEHGWDIADPDGKSRKYRLVRRLMSHLVRKFVAVSADLRSWLTTSVGIPSDKIILICNGVDTERFKPAASTEKREAADGASGEGSVVIGSITRFSPIKDPMNLVEAFIALRSRQSESSKRVCLLIAGDGELRLRAMARLEEAGVAESTYLPGGRDDVPDLLRRLDVFVLGSLREGISNTILEAMATGLPVVATATGGTRELVVPGETGSLVPPGDCDALADAIELYVLDPSLRRLHGRHARERALERFSIDAMVERYDALYRDALRPARQ